MAIVKSATMCCNQGRLWDCGKGVPSFVVGLWVLKDAINGACSKHGAGRYEWPPDPQEERMTVAGAQRIEGWYCKFGKTIINNP